MHRVSGFPALHRGNSSGAPSGRGQYLHGFFDAFFDDPFFSDPFSHDPFFQQHSPFFSSPLFSAVNSQPSDNAFGNPTREPVEGVFYTGRPRTHSMHTRPQFSRPPLQLLPAPHIVEMDAGDAQPCSWEQPLVEHPDSDSDDAEAAASDGASEKHELLGVQAGPSNPQASVRDIPIHWGDVPSPPAANSISGVTISEVDPDLDMDWQSGHASADDASATAPAPLEERPPLPRERTHWQQGRSGQTPPQQPDIGWRNRERSFPRSWFSHSGRKGSDR